MADISKIKLPDGTTYDIKDAIAQAKFPVAVTDGGTGRTSALEGFWTLESRGYSTDANTALSVGLYDTNTATQNLPPLASSQGNGCGVLIVYVSTIGTHNNSNNWIWQMWLNTTTNNLYIRKKVNNNSWNAWTTELDAIRSNQYYEATTPAYGINLNNSDIVGVNSIYTNDSSDNAKEGIQFLRSTTSVDSLWAKSGTLYFTPNRTLGQNTGPQGDLPLYTVPWYGTDTTDLSIRPYVAFARANRLAFLPADQIIIEETTDGGQTWTSGGYTDIAKQSLFATRGASIKIPLLNGAKSTNCGVRITITGMKYNVPEGTLETEKYNYWNTEYVKSPERYCNLREMWFWMSANNDTVRCQVYRATGAKPDNWQVCFNTDFGMTGWSGSDWIRFNGNWVFGGGINQTGNFWNWRIIFWSRMADGKDAFNSNTQQTINGISGYGDNVWTTPNGLMKEDHLYTWDVNMNAAFPARVQAARFQGVGTELTALNGSNITSGTVAADRIAALSASKITSGTFDTARIPNLDASKIVSGTLDKQRLPLITGATSSANGTSGAVPAPISGQQNNYLKGNGEWEPLTLQQLQPLETHTYTDIIGTENNNRYASFFFAKVNSENYTDVWRVKMKITVTVPGQVNYNSSTITEIWGTENTFLSYKNQNAIKNTSYKPVYYVSYFRPSSTGFANGCRGWLGINLIYSTNPTDTSYKRTCVVELLDCENCTVEFENNVITPDNIPGRAANTSWYTSTHSSFDNFDFYSQGLREIGDDNSTSISRLFNYYAYYTTKNALYRYQLVFSVSEDQVTPLNNSDNNPNANKVMFTDVEFDPFGRIFYYNNTTVINANSLVNNNGLHFMFDLADIRYTFNVTSGTATETAMHLDNQKNVYLKVIPLENGKCKIASAVPLVQELPTTEDGYWYILLGRQYDWYRIVLFAEHPVYEYYNGELRQRIRGNASTATTFSTNKEVKLTGDITGSASSTGGWSIATTIGEGKVTNAKLANSKITIGGIDVSLGGSLSLEDLGLSNAMHFIGITTTIMSDGLTTKNVTINNKTYTPSNGDVVLYNDSEFVWTGTAWELLGRDSSFKTVQSVVNDPTASGNAISFIDTISQNANGVITATKKSVPVFVKSGADAAAGLVPSPDTTAGTTKYLREDGTWTVPPDTHYTTHLYVNATAAGATSNAATTNTDTYLHLYDNTTKRETVQLKGDNTITVSATNDGVITISSIDNNNAVTHTLAKTTKYYITGTTSDTTSTGSDFFDTGIYATTNAGELSAVKYSYNNNGTEKAYSYYNLSDDSIDFVFI